MGNFVIALVSFAAGFGAAWSWQGSRADTRVNALTAKHEKESGDAARTASQKIKEAEDRTDAIDKAAAIRVADLDRVLQETQHELKTATRNRPCLGGSALLLLDRAPGLHPGPADPAPAGPLYRGSTPAAADPEDETQDYATDTQVADWIAGAAVLYERCRGRIRDIRLWVEGGIPRSGPALKDVASD